MPKLLRHLLKLVGVLAIVAWSLVPIGLIAMSSFKADRDILSTGSTFAFGPVSKMTDAPSSGTKDQLASAEGLMVPSSRMKRTITSRLVSGASKIVFEALISGKLPPPPAR